jgi:Tfp pilus assembly protein PilO
MGANRLWLVGAVVLIAVMLAGTWFLGVSPQLGAAATSAADTASVQAQNVANQQTLDALKKQYEDIESLRSDLEDLRESVPPELDQASMLDELNTLAAANGVTIASVTFEAPQPYLPGDATDPEVIAASASVSSGNFYVVPVKLSVTGPTGAAFAFLNDLQTGTRLFLVYELSITGTDDPNSGVSTFGISGEIFVLTGAGASAPATPTDGGIPG